MPYVICEANFWTVAVVDFVVGLCLGLTSRFRFDWRRCFTEHLCLGDDLLTFEIESLDAGYGHAIPTTVRKTPNCAEEVPQQMQNRDSSPRETNDRNEGDRAIHNRYRRSHCHSNELPKREPWYKQEDD